VPLLLNHAEPCMIFTSGFLSKQAVEDQRGGSYRAVRCRFGNRQIPHDHFPRLKGLRQLHWSIATGDGEPLVTGGSIDCQALPVKPEDRFILRESYSLFALP
jgi:hypothetical protein